MALLSYSLSADFMLMHKISFFLCGNIFPTENRMYLRIPTNPVLSVYISTVRTIIYAHTIADATKSYGRPRSTTYVNGGMTV